MCIVYPCTPKSVCQSQRKTVITKADLPNAPMYDECTSCIMWVCRYASVQHKYTIVRHACQVNSPCKFVKHIRQAQSSSTLVQHSCQAHLVSISVKHMCQAICLHDKGVTSHEAEPVHARHIVGFNESHKQHALRPSCPVLISLYHTSTTCW